jgi:PASTA domain
MPMTRRPWLIPVLMTFAAFAITGCGGSGDSGGSTVEVPSVTGKPVAEARAAIIDAGLEALVQKRESEEPAGKVVHQGTPAGTKVPENTVVTLHVSGSTKVKVPPPAAPAPKPAPEVSKKEVDIALSNLSPEFCRAYAQILSAGLGEGTAYGNFLRAYRQGGFEGGPSARKVFDELVSRC